MKNNFLLIGFYFDFSLVACGGDKNRKTFDKTNSYSDSTSAKKSTSNTSSTNNSSTTSSTAWTDGQRLPDMPIE